MKHSIFLSLFTYKTRLLADSSFSLGVASKLNYVFRMQIRSFTYKPRGFLLGSYGTDHTVSTLSVETKLAISTAFLLLQTARS